MKKPDHTNQKQDDKRTHWFHNTLIFVLVTALISACIWYYQLGGKKWYQYTYHRNHEPFTLRKSTSTDPLYSDARLKKSLAHSKIAEMYDLDTIVSSSFVIPGLKATRTIVKDTPGTMDICTSMTPQGVAVTDDYMFISAYCYTKEHHSVIYMIDRKTKQFLKELVMPDLSHLGSIAYDPDHDNLWICCYDQTLKLPALSVISLENIMNYSFDSRFEPIVYNSSYPLLTILHASYMTYANEAIYVGDFAVEKKDMTFLERFNIQKDGTIAKVDNPLADLTNTDNTVILPDHTTVISGQMQGISFSNGICTMIQSYGSSANSYMYLFDASNPDELYDQKIENALSAIELPPLAEEIAVDGSNNVFICFESAAYAYRARDCIHIDRILVLPE